MQKTALQIAHEVIVKVAADPTYGEVDPQLVSDFGRMSRNVGMPMTAGMLGPLAGGAGALAGGVSGGLGGGVRGALRGAGLGGLAGLGVGALGGAGLGALIARSAKTQMAGAPYQEEGAQAIRENLQVPLKERLMMALEGAKSAYK